MPPPRTIAAVCFPTPTTASSVRQLSGDTTLWGAMSMHGNAGISRHTKDEAILTPGLPPPDDRQISEGSILKMRALLTIHFLATGYKGLVTAFENCIVPVDLSKVTLEKSFDEYLGRPLQQTVDDTCAIVSTAKCVEVQHRWEYETWHGLGTYPCNAAAPPQTSSSLCSHGEMESREWC
uniref:Uncharacterized protein n=1 Tax=Oryza meridionalis TaxID=40149 RepID=A0A0E0EST4_9ORYZ